MRTHQRPNQATQMSESVELLTTFVMAFNSGSYKECASMLDNIMTEILGHGKYYLKKTLSSMMLIMSDKFKLVYPHIKQKIFFSDPNELEGS